MNISGDELQICFDMWQRLTNDNLDTTSETNETLPKNTVSMLSIFHSNFTTSKYGRIFTHELNAYL